MAQPVSADCGDEQDKGRQPKQVLAERIQSFVNFPGRRAQLHKESAPMSVDRRIEEPEALPLHLPVLESSFLTLSSQRAFGNGFERMLGQKVRKVDRLALRGENLQILSSMILGIGFRHFLAE